MIHPLMVALVIVPVLAGSCSLWLREVPAQPLPAPIPSEVPSPSETRKPAPVTKSPLVMEMSNWLEPINISNTKGNLSLSPAVPHWLLRDKAGNVIFIWDEVHLDPQFHVSSMEYLLVSQENGIWSQAASFLSNLTIDEEGPGYGIPVKWKGNRGMLGPLFVSEDGAIHLFWLGKPRPDAHHSQIYWSKKTTQSEWSEPTLIFDGPGGDVGPRTTEDSEGTIHVTVEVGAREIFYFAKTRDDQWSKPVRLSFVAPTSQWPFSNLAIDGDGTVHLAWRDFDRRKWLYTTKPKGADWKEPTEITPAGLKQDRWFPLFTMMMDEQENLHFGWTSTYDYFGEKGNSQDIFHSVKPRNGEMSEAVNISQAYTKHARDPIFRFDRHGVLHGMYAMGGSEPRLMYITRAIDGTWSKPESIIPGVYDQRGYLTVNRMKIQVEWPLDFYVDDKGVHAFWQGSVLSGGEGTGKPFELEQELFYSFKPISNK